MPGIEDIDEDEDKGEADMGEVAEGDDGEDDIDELEELSESERDKVISETAAVREAVSKVSVCDCFIIYLTIVSQLRKLLFAIIHSTTIALPAWRCHCESHKLKPNLIPHDVVT
jgi:hypothetical protein